MQGEQCPPTLPIGRQCCYLLLAIPLRFLLFIFIAISVPKVPQNIDLNDSDDENDKKPAAEESNKVIEATEATVIEGSEKKKKDQ